ncbi:T9SS type A sorting domain-containing protein [candidate division KSB1 bacterium]|nr:T9SS type A sorting domain-containing protein [candidate division KSB1 bacterium]
MKKGNQMMDSRTRLSLLIFLFLWTNHSGAVEILPTNSDIRYTGRWNFDDLSIPWVSWQGSSIIVEFEGTGISIDMSGTRTEQYRVIIDGEPENDRRYFSSSRDTYIMAEGLANGIHTLEIMKETFNGRSYFYGLNVTGNGILPLPDRPALRIEFFGDSNMNGSSNYSEKNSGDMGTYYAFPAMVTRMLGAEMNNQSVGGAQLYGTGDNCVGSFIFSEDYYTQDPDYRSGFDPHIIVVNAGANDIGNSKSVIKQRYKNVVADLRTVYGDTPQIILMNSYSWDVNEPANYTHEVVAELGDPNLSVCLFPWLWEQWHGCQWDHSGEAHVLLDHITALNPDWTQVNPGDIFDGFGRNSDFANGSFEHAASFGGFGWRYHEDGVERIHDPNRAANGEYYIRLQAGEKVHQPTDATGDFLPGATVGGETYFITAKIRGVSEGAQAQIITDFQGQQIWTRGNAQSTPFSLTTEWETYTASAVAPAGIWILFNTLQAVTGTVEFDAVSMSNIDPEVTGVGGDKTTGSLKQAKDEIQVYPNPFNQSTTVALHLKSNSEVRLDAYNIYGQKVTELVNRDMDAGTFNVNWGAKDLPSGMYFLVLEANSTFLTKKTTLLK